jgi:hypothetical protein
VGKDAFLHSFEIRPSGLTWDSADPELEPGWVEKKIEKVMTRCDPAG